MATAYADIIIRAKGDSVAADLGKVTSSFRKLEGTVEGIGRQISTVGSIIGLSFGAAGLKNLITSADAFKSLEARIKGITAQTGDFEAVSEALRSISRDTGSPLEATVSVFQSLARSRGELGATNAQMLTLTQLVQQLGVIGGASTGAMQAGLLQFGQAMSAGVVRAEEWNSILENLPELANAIAAGLGKSAGEVRQMVLQGKLLSTDVFNVLIGQAADIDARFAQMPVTAERGWNALTQSLTKALSAMDRAAGITDLIGRGLKGWANYLDPTTEDRFNQLIAERERLMSITPTGPGGRPNPGFNAAQKQLQAVNAEIRKLSDERTKQQQAEAAAGAETENLSTVQKLRLQDQQKEVKALTSSYDKLVESIRASQLAASGPAEKDVKSASVLDINRLRDQAQSYIEKGKGSADFQKALPLLQQAQKINDSLLASGQITKGYYLTQAELLLKLAEAGRAVQSGEKPGAALGIAPVANEQANQLYLEQSRAFWAQNPAYQPVVPVPPEMLGDVFSGVTGYDEESGRVVVSAAGLAGGGLISGPGTATSDSIMARLSNGEYVMRQAAVSRYGVGMLSAMNRLRLPRFSSGGAVGGSPSTSFSINLNGHAMTATAPSGPAADFRAELAREVLRRGRR